MAPRSKIDGLPPEVRAKLDRRLLEQGFSDYEALVQFLCDQGFEISKSAVHRYGQDFERKVGMMSRAIEQAKAIVEAAPDQEGAVNEAILRLVQENLFNLLLNAGDGLEPKDLATVARSIADITRASISQKKFMEEVRGKLEAKFKALEGQSQQRGLDLATLKQIREEIYGIV